MAIESFTQDEVIFDINVLYLYANQRVSFD